MGSGLSPKGYIPVMSIDGEVIRESKVCVERVAKLSASVEGATSLLPEHRDLATELVQICDALPKTSRSRELDEMIRKVRLEIMRPE